jgi:adenylylsulfate kinase
LLTRNGVIALVAAISPYRAVREEVRASIGTFVEVYVNAPLEVCEARDPKRLYRKARAGALPAFTGVDDPYEPPQHPEPRACRTTSLTDEFPGAEEQDGHQYETQRPLGKPWSESTWRLVLIASSPE